jgi:microcystin-dependent protein
VSRVTYGTLFAAVGTTYGAGDGSTTFNVPDLRGRAVAGKNDMGVQCGIANDE